MEESSVLKALHAENGQLFSNTRIVVEPHIRSHGSGGGTAQ
jgi:hypothetical protein